MPKYVNNVNITYIGGEIITTGYLKVHALTQQDHPLYNANVRVYKNDNGKISLAKECKTDQDGMTERLELDAPDPVFSFDKRGLERPYTRYNVEVTKDGYDPQERNNVQVFPHQISTLPVYMERCVGRQPKRNVIDIGEHHLFQPGDPHA